MTLTENTQTFTLNTGAKIPQVGFGTWKSKDGEGYQSTKIALANGYRHIDTAAIYGNEEEVGKAIKESGIPREELFITTKLWNSDHKKATEALDTSLKKLGLDYVDLYLIHWPASTDESGQKYSDWNYIDTYKELQKIYKNTKKVRAIGVSNFGLKEFDKFFADPEITVVPAANQIEAHPLLQQPDLVEFLNKKNILIEAYSPLGSTGTPFLKNDKLVEIAKKNGVEVAQLILSWGVQRGTVVLPKSTTESRIISNLKTFKLSQEDFDAVTELEKAYGTKRVNTASFHEF